MRVRGIPHSVDFVTLLGMCSLVQNKDGGCFRFDYRTGKENLMFIAFVSLVTSYNIVIERVPTASLLIFDSMLVVITSFIQAPKKTNAVCV